MKQFSVLPSVFLGVCSLSCVFIFSYLLGTGPGIALALFVGCISWTTYILACLARQLWQETEIQNETAQSQSTRELTQHYRRTKQALKDLELDHMMGKVSVEDYHLLRNQYRARAISLLARLDAKESVMEQILADIQIRRNHLQGASQ